MSAWAHLEACKRSAPGRKRPPGVSPMVEAVASAAVMGLQVRRVRVEVSITRGTPLIQIIGLAENAVREGRERIRAAAAQLGLHVPGLRITVNLAPAGLRKHGAAFDLPIMVAILAAAGQLSLEGALSYAMVGELGLDGRLRPVRGALPIALHSARAKDVAGLILPFDNLREARPVTGLEVRGARTLPEVLDFLRGRRALPGPMDLSADRPARPASGLPDLARVYGQARAKRALEVAAAGGHNLLLRGAPGAGKTTLARCLPGILPPMGTEEAVEVTAIHSVAGRLRPDSGLLTARPFRAPHHTISEAGLVGGGSTPRPGEVSLAHRGVLFLDELPEFGRRVLEVLRQPLEEGAVHLVRARVAVTFPSRFTLVAALNPCPCGYQGDGTERCTCDPARVERYLGRVSGPVLDRIDLHLDVPAVRWREMTETATGESSATVRERVREARERAARRFRGGASNGAGPPAAGAGHDGLGIRTTGLTCNAEMGAAEIRAHCALEAAGEAFLREAVERFGLSARGYHRTLRVARTIADLAGRERIEAAHVAEAVQYRLPGRGGG